MIGSTCARSNAITARSSNARPATRLSGFGPWLRRLPSPAARMTPAVDA
jgi:hypothetical protein